MKLTGADKTIIRNIVGRLHVGASDEEVKTEILGKLRGASEAAKKACIKEGLAAHARNQMIYKRVQSGRF